MLVMNKRELIDKLENYLANHGFDYRYTLDYFINDYNLWNKYSSNTLKCVTGILYKFINNDVGNEVVNIDLVNAIVKCLLDSNDPDLMNIAWNTFISCINDNRYILYDEVSKARDKWSNETDVIIANHTQILETQRLIIKPNNDISSKKLAKYIDTYDKSNNDFSFFVASYFDVNIIIFILTLKETNIDIGFVGLEYSICEECYYLNYYIKKKYRKHGYVKEGIKAVLKAIKDNKIVIYGEINRVFIYEEKQLNIKFLKLIVDEGNVASFNTAKAVGFNYEGRIIQYIYGKHEMKHNFLLFL